MYEHVGSRIMDYGALFVGLSLASTGLAVMIHDAYRSRRIRATKQQTEITIIGFEMDVGLRSERRDVD